MKPLLILMSTIFFFSCHQKEIERCEYQQYFQEVSNALSEKHTNNNWTKANELFKSAFKMVKTPFGNDLEEALEISIKLKDEKQTQLITQQLLKGGIPMEYFNQFSSIVKSAWWKKMDFPQLEKEYQRDYDKTLLNELLSLRTQDSLFNVEYHQFRKGEKEVELNYLIEKATEIYDGFKELVNTHGFPSEVNTGYFYSDGKIKTLPTHVVLIHIHQLGEPLIRNEFTYENLICEGYLTEFEYDSLNNIVKSFRKGKGIEYEMKIYHEKYKNKY